MDLKYILIYGLGAFNFIYAFGMLYGMKIDSDMQKLKDARFRRDMEYARQAIKNLNPCELSGTLNTDFTL